MQENMALRKFLKPLVSSLKQSAVPELLNEHECHCEQDDCVVKCYCLNSSQPCTAALTCKASWMERKDNVQIPLFFHFLNIGLWE